MDRDVFVARRWGQPPASDFRAPPDRNPAYLDPVNQQSSSAFQRTKKKHRQSYPTPPEWTDNARMDLTGIILRLLAWLRPLAWYNHVFCRVMNVALRMWDDEPSRRWFAENAPGRADLEQKIADAEQCLNIIIALRARELLGLPIEPEDRPGLRGRCARIHVAPSMERLGARLARLAERYEDMERLARLRAACIRRERDQAPVLLNPSHQPEPSDPACDALAWLLAHAQPFAIPRALAPDIAGLRIRAPP